MNSNFYDYDYDIGELVLVNKKQYGIIVDKFDTNLYRVLLQGSAEIVWFSYISLQRAINEK
jgi:hypothetical protein